MQFDPLHSPFIHQYVPKNRHTYIRITHKGEVKVSTPLKSLNEVRKLLCERTSWINEKLIYIHEKKSSKCIPGETILFRGEIRDLEHFPKLKEKILQNSNIKKYYDDFYRYEALETLPSRIRFYGTKMGLMPSEIRYKKLRRKWGSCDSNGVVTFNTLMLQLSYEHIDYIIVHELAHLRHMNHSKAFHELVRHYLPHEKKLRSELRAIIPHVF